jgi:hypothetical protein
MQALFPNAEVSIMALFFDFFMCSLQYPGAVVVVIVAPGYCKEHMKKSKNKAIILTSALGNKACILPLKSGNLS